MACDFPAIAAILLHLIGADAPHAIDGDTLVLAGQTIRLEGIDAPESEQLCSGPDGLPYACGVKARAALARLLKKNPVACHETGRDRYGRTLALCTAGALDVNREMVRRGWAFAFVRYSDRFVADEDEARRARRGLWRGQAEFPWEWRARRREGGQDGR